MRHRLAAADAVTRVGVGRRRHRRRSPDWSTTVLVTLRPAGPQKWSDAEVPTAEVDVFRAEAASPASPSRGVREPVQSIM